MTDEQLKVVRDEIIKAIGMTVPPAIEKVVNGNIRALSTKLEDHIVQHKEDVDKLNDRFDPESEHYILKDVQGIIEAYKGSKVLGELLKWSAGVGVAYLIVKGWLRP